MRQLKNRLLKAPFKIGDKVKYLGQRKSWTVLNGKEFPNIFPGMVATISETIEPRNGYGQLGVDDEVEPLIDHGHDGYNVYKNDAGQGRIIWPKDKKEWEKLGG